MKVGTLCFATERGLGYLAKSFYDNGIITDVAVLNHGKIPTQLQWYPGSLYITRRPLPNPQMKKLIEDADVMLFFETPFDWELIKYAKQVGTKTALMTMYECSPTPKNMPHKPDLFICPSVLDADIFHKENHVFIPVPVEVPWTQRTKALRFVHNSGYIGLNGRNGTLELLQAMQYVESPIELTVRCQEPRGLTKLQQQVPKVLNDKRVKFEGHVPYEDLYKHFDVSVAPEKFNGLSLPLQEAHAQGLLVMTTNRYPHNTWLPTEPLIPVKEYITAKVAGRFMSFSQAVLEPKLIAQTIDQWYGRNITEQSTIGKYWAEGMSWASLKPKYIEALTTC